MKRGSMSRTLRVGVPVVALGAVVACAAYFGLNAQGGLVTANADNAPALGNTLGGNDTAELGTYTAYDPTVNAEHQGGEVMEEDALQQERVAGGAVGEVVSQNLPEVEGIVDGTPGDYVPTYGMNFQAPALSQAIIDAVNGGSLEGLPQNHLDSGLTPDDCTSCHTITE